MDTVGGDPPAVISFLGTPRRQPPTAVEASPRKQAAHSTEQTAAFHGRFPSDFGASASTRIEYKNSYRLIQSQNQSIKLKPK